MANFDRTEPVDELVAEGFGTLTAQERRVTTGRGVWRDGRWAVVFARPLTSDDPLDYQFHLGARGTVAVAVWEGSAGNVGGRKHWSNWVPFEVQI
jgi:DMSO reductase family type II enzyme heme b subunit